MEGLREQYEALLNEGISEEVAAYQVSYHSTLLLSLSLCFYRRY